MHPKHLPGTRGGEVRRTAGRIRRARPLPATLTATGADEAGHTAPTMDDVRGRLGHNSIRAALIYQHAAREQDKRIADALSDHITPGAGSGTPSRGSDGHS